MKAFLFVCALVVSQLASADIKIMSFEGIDGIQFEGNSYILSLPYGSTEEFKVTFFSTDKVGMPIITGLYSSVETKLSQSFPVLAVNQITSIESSIMSLFTYGPIYRVGIDGNNDGMLNGSDDDFLSVQMIFN